MKKHGILMVRSKKNIYIFIMQDYYGVDDDRLKGITNFVVTP